MPCMALPECSTSQVVAAVAENVHTAGVLKGPENLYVNVTKGIFTNIDDSFPATKGHLRNTDTKLEAVETELDEYKKQTTAIINTLVGEVNSLTPVGIPCQVTCHRNVFSGH